MMNDTQAHFCYLCVPVDEPFSCIGLINNMCVKSYLGPNEVRVTQIRFYVSLTEARVNRTGCNARSIKLNLIIKKNILLGSFFAEQIEWSTVKYLIIWIVIKNKSQKLKSLLRFWCKIYIPKNSIYKKKIVKCFCKQLPRQQTHDFFVVLQFYIHRAGGNRSWCYIDGHFHHWYSRQQG